jgi:hypothetical protein
MISSFMLCVFILFVICYLPHCTLFLSYGSRWKCYSCLSSSLHSLSKLCSWLEMLLMLDQENMLVAGSIVVWLDAIRVTWSVL